MAQLNDFMARIDLSVLNDYVAANGKDVVYAKGERIVQQGHLCRYVGVVKSGYFKYMALNSKGQEVVTGFSFEGEVVTDYVQGFLYDQPSLTSIVAGCDAEVQRVSVEDGDYVLYEERGIMMAAPHYGLGKKEGLFIRKLPQGIRLYDYGNRKVNCFKVDTLKGCMYGLELGTSPAAWVLPIDSAKYHSHAKEITALIDSLYQLQSLLSQESYGIFVYPNNFAEINYEGGEISYTDSISYDIDFSESDSLRIIIYDGKFPHLSFPKNAIGDFSPNEVKTFIEKLKGGKR